MNDVFLRLVGQPTDSKRDPPDTLVPDDQQPRQFFVELLVVLVVGEEGGPDPEEVRQGSLVADDGLVRLPERSCDKYGADIVIPSALSAAITSAEVCGPRPGG